MRFGSLFYFVFLFEQLHNLPSNSTDLVLTGDDEGIFGVDAQFLFAIKPLDREKQPSYSLQVVSSLVHKTLEFLTVVPPQSLIRVSLWSCKLTPVFVGPAGVLQTVWCPSEHQISGASPELHSRSVRHRQERQRAHFHRTEHERQRAAWASQR